MKKLTFILMAAFLLVFSACKTQQNTTTTLSPQGGERKVIPCVEESMDDDECYRALGIGENVNMQNARSAAFDAAKSMLHKRLGGLVKGLSSDYSRTVSGNVQQDKVQRIMEGEMYTVVDKMLNDAAKTCEEMYKNASGNYESYITIKVSKKEIVDQMSSTLSKNEELEIEFNRDQFRKFAEQKMKELGNYTGE